MTDWEKLVKGTIRVKFKQLLRVVMPMTLQLAFRKNQLDDLKIVRDLTASELSEIISKIKAISPPPLRPVAIRKVLSEVIKDAEAESAFMRQLTSGCSLLRQRNITAEELIEGINFGIIKAVEGRWTDSELNKWKEKKDLICELFSLESIGSIVKALEISYEYPNILQTSKILTDIRPVFDDAGTSFHGAIVSHSLQVYFDNSSGNQNISLSLDHDDVVQLKNSCDRALLKAETAKRIMIDQLHIPSYICGEEDDD